MNITQPLEGMTWGELRAFVALGKGEPDDAEVVQEFDSHGNFEPIGLSIYGFQVP